MKHSLIMFIRRSLIGGSLLLCFVIPAVAFSQPVLAESCTLPDGSTGATLASDNRICCPTNVASDGTSCLFAKYVNPVIALLSACVALVIVISIIYGGIQYVTSAGDPQKAAEGKKRITNALVALIAFVLLFAFLQFLIPGGIV